MKITCLIIVFLLLLFPAGVIFSQDLFITKDTVINNTWNIPSGAILKFGSKGHISGKGTIKGVSPLQEEIKPTETASEADNNPFEEPLVSLFE